MTKTASVIGVKYRADPTKITKVTVVKYETLGQQFDTEQEAKHYARKCAFRELVGDKCWNDMNKDDIVRILFDDSYAAMVEIFKCDS